MLDRLRARWTEEEGFTLVELLVVMLIIGILAAIAIPSFFAQKDKATDADAKSAAKTAQTAIETFATEHGGSYADAAADGSDLVTIEPTLTGQNIAVSDQGPKTYTITVTSDTTNTFSIGRNDDGTTSLTCTGSSGGCAGGTW